MANKRQLQAENDRLKAEAEARDKADNEAAEKANAPAEPNAPAEAPATALAEPPVEAPAEPEQEQTDEDFITAEQSNAFAAVIESMQQTRAIPQLKVGALKAMYPVWGEQLEAIFPE